MTPTPRERFEEEFWHIDEMMMIPPKEMILEFVDALLEEARQEAREEMITYISKHQWWEETEDNYRERFWFAPKYSSL